jgi:hypothetical protein
MTMTQLILVLLVVGCAGIATYCKRSLVREARGAEIHAHSDGTVHEHHRGDSPHSHPRLTERHERLLGRLFRDPA